jgi:DNA modification methylase
MTPKIETRLVADLIPYAANSRTHSDAQVAQIAASIKEFGWTNPILVAGDDTIIAGHGRLLAARKLALVEVPVIVLDHLSKSQQRALVIADNQLALNAGWNMDMLKAEIEDLQLDDFDLNILGFDDKFLDGLLEPEPTAGLTDEDAVPEVPETPKTVLGDVWVLGNHRLMCGDSTSVDALEKLMEGQSADMVFTDPPYGIDYSGGRTQVVATKTYGKLKNDDLKGDDLGNLICNVFTNAKPEADAYICVSPIMQKPFLDWLEAAGKKIGAVIVWDKKQPGLGYMHYRRQTEFILFVPGRQFKKGDKSDFDLWAISRDNGSDYQHGTQKPVALPSRAIENSSKSGDMVLDLFGGSGSTLIACEKTGRSNRSMELDPKYCDVIVKRWQDFTGKEATHAETGETFNGSR